MISYYVSQTARPKGGAHVTVAYEGETYAMLVKHFSHTELDDNHWTHTHDEYHVLIYLRDGILALDDGEYAVAKDEVVVINPNQAHRFRPGKSGKSEYYEVTFTFMCNKGKTLCLPFDDILLFLFPQESRIPKQTIFMLPAETVETMKRAFFTFPKAAYHTFRENYFGVALEASVVSFLHAFAEGARTIENAADNASPGAKWVERITRHIYFNYNRKLTLDDIAAKCNANPRYLCRVFKRETGETIISFLTRFRIETAEAILRNSEYRVKDVGRMVGIDDEYYFNRMFKKVRGYAPGAVRMGMPRDKR